MKSGFKKFGQEVGRRRRDLRLSQSQLAGAADVSVRTVSRLEAGTDRSRPRIDVILRIARALQEPSPIPFLRLAGHTDLSEEEIEARYHRIPPQARRGPRIGIAEEQLIESAERYLNGLLDRSVSIWFIGPKALPFSRSQFVQDAWVANLNAGRDYCILWLLDKFDVRTFADLASALALISGRVDANACGRIRHYQFALRKDRISEAARSAFLDFQKRLPTNQFFEMRPDQFPKRDADELALYWQPFSSLVLYSPEQLADRPVANVCMHDVAAFHDGEPLDAFLWLSPGVAYALNALVRSIQQAFRPSATAEDGVQSS